MSTATDPRPTRRRLLDAAAVVFGERGYVEASVKQVADQAGLTTGALYANFPSKAALFIEVIGEQYRAVLSGAGAGGDRPAGVHDAVERFVRSYVGRIREGSAEVYAQNLELLVLMLRDVDGLAAVLGGQHAGQFVMRRYLEVLAAEAEAHGGGGPVDARRLTSLLVALAGGATQVRILVPELVAVDDVAAAARHLVDTPLPAPSPTDPTRVASRTDRAPVAAAALVPAHEAAPAPPVPLHDVLAGTALAVRSGEPTLVLLLPLSDLRLLEALHAAARDVVPERGSLRVIAVLADDPTAPGAFAIMGLTMFDLAVHLPAVGEVLDLHLVLDDGSAAPVAFGLDPARPWAVALDRAGLVRGTARADAASTAALVAALAAEAGTSVGSSDA